MPSRREGVDDTLQNLSQPIVRVDLKDYASLLDVPETILQKIEPLFFTSIWRGVRHRTQLRTVQMCVLVSEA